jgi:hypothetical protein
MVISAAAIRIDAYSMKACERKGKTVESILRLRTLCFVQSDYCAMDVMVECLILMCVPSVT